MHASAGPPGYSPDWVPSGTVTSGDGHFPAMYGLADKLVLGKVKEALGLQECKFGFTGAAPITVKTLEYFGALGIQVRFFTEILDDFPRFVDEIWRFQTEFWAGE